MLDAKGIVSSWNPGAARFKGYEADEIIGRHFSEFYTEEERNAGIPDLALKVAASEGRFEREGWRVRKDGTRFWAHVVIDPIRSPSGETIGYAKVTRDLTERRAAEEALQRSQEQFRLLVQGVTDYAIFMLDPEGNVASWNAGAQHIKGYAPGEIIGSHFSRFYTSEDLAEGVPTRGLATAARDGRWEAEGLRKRKDGSTFWAHVVIDAIRDEDGKIIGFAKVTRDITERKEAEQSLQQAQAALAQAQKMEALGQLTGGVAHDFNNLLQVISSNLHLAAKDVAGNPRAEVRIQNALAGVSRGARLAQQFLAFGRRQALEPKVINVGRFVRGMDDMLRRTIGADIEFETSIAGGLWNTLLDPNQVENALLNLAINARDAMPDGGRLTIEAGNAFLDDRYAARHEGVRPGQYVMLAVTDTGSGMPADVVQRAFEPFFSTKPEGKGTGLGLSDGGRQSPSIRYALAFENPALAAASGDSVCRYVMYSLIWWSVMCRPGKASIPSCRDESTACTSPAQPPDGYKKRATPMWTAFRSGYALPSVRPPWAQSHPDCRWSLTLIAAAQALKREVIRNKLYALT